MVKVQLNDDDKKVRERVTHTSCMKVEHRQLSELQEELLGQWLCPPVSDVVSATHTNNIQNITLHLLPHPKVAHFDVA